MRQLQYDLTDSAVRFIYFPVLSVTYRLAIVLPKTHRSTMMRRNNIIIPTLGLLVVLQCSFVLFAQVSAECDITKCNVPKHYREIGCEPTKYADDDKDKCCPIEYNCDEIEKQDKTKCHYRGKSFADGDRMDGEVNCRAGCYCREGQFTCAYVECPELVFNRPEPHCVIQNSRSQCCSENIVCDQKDIDLLPVCHFENKKYHKGQLMWPESERCFSCLCDEKFDNSTTVSKNPHCQEVHCAIDLSYLSKIRTGCVPVYFGEPTCCPITTKCPTEKDKPIPAVGRQAPNPNLKCKFGDHELQIGDKVTDDNKCVDCECAIPPMITCVQKRDC